MAKIKNEVPRFVNIDLGEMTDSVVSLKNNLINVDLFNGLKADFEGYRMLYDSNKNQFTLKTVGTLPTDYTLSGYYFGDSLYFNGQVIIDRGKTEFVVGTHIGEISLDSLGVFPEGLVRQVSIMGSNNIKIKTKFDYVYVGMTTGVPEDFGEDKYRKCSENKSSVSDIKSTAKGQIAVGFYHYLTGAVDNINDIDAEKVGTEQAIKFLEKIVQYDRNTGKMGDVTTLNGCLVPVVVFMDNVTQKEYYGPAPFGIKKNLENF